MFFTMFLMSATKLEMVIAGVYEESLVIVNDAELEIYCDPGKVLIFIVTEAEVALFQTKCF